MRMYPTQAAYESAVLAMGATTVSFGTVFSKPLFLIPIKAAFTPGPSPAVTDADIADFDGSTPLVYASAARIPVADVLTSELRINMPAPVGGNQFTTSGVTNLPQTIYGAVLGTSSTTVEGGVLYGSGTLDEPMTLTASGQQIDFGQIEFPFTYPLHS